MEILLVPLSALVVLDGTLLWTDVHSHVFSGVFSRFPSGQTEQDVFENRCVKNRFRRR